MLETPRLGVSTVAPIFLTSTTIVYDCLPYKMLGFVPLSNLRHTQGERFYDLLCRLGRAVFGRNPTMLATK